MAKYENEFSNFPRQKITLHHFRNMDGSAAPIIHQIHALCLQGAYDKAAGIIQNNFNILSHYIVDAITFRTWEEEIYNTQTYAKQKQQSVYFDEQEDDFDGIEGDVWLGGD